MVIDFCHFARVLHIIAFFSPVRTERENCKLVEACMFEKYNKHNNKKYIQEIYLIRLQYLKPHRGYQKTDTSYLKIYSHTQKTFLWLSWTACHWASKGGGRSSAAQLPNLKHSRPNQKEKNLQNYHCTGGGNPHHSAGTP